MRFTLQTSIAAAVRLKIVSDVNQQKLKTEAKQDSLREREHQAIAGVLALSAQVKSIEREYEMYSDCGIDYHYEDEISPLQAKISTLVNLRENRQNIVPRSWGLEHKPTKFTHRAKNTIYEAGCVLDSYYKGKTYLVTLTLPGTGTDLYQALGNWSGWIMDRLNREMRRVPDLLTYYVWELQKRGALHLHYVVSHDNPTIAKQLAEGLEYNWFELLQELCHKAGLDFFKSPFAPTGTWRYTPQYWKSQVEPVKKSVARYLSKYLSKNINSKRHHKFFPARWWGIGRLLRSVVLEHRVSVSVDCEDSLANHLLCEMTDLLRKFEPIQEFPYHFDKKIIDRSGQERSLIWGCGLILNFSDDNRSDWLELRSNLSDLINTDYVFHVAEELAVTHDYIPPMRPNSFGHTIEQGLQIPIQHPSSLARGG